MLLSPIEEPPKDNIPVTLDCAYLHGSVVILPSSKTQRKDIDSDVIWFQGMVSDMFFAVCCSLYIHSELCHIEVQVHCAASFVMSLIKVRVHCTVNFVTSRSLSLLHSKLCYTSKFEFTVQRTLSHIEVQVHCTELCLSSKFRFIVQQTLLLSFFIVILTL